MRKLITILLLAFGLTQVASAVKVYPPIEQKTYDRTHKEAKCEFATAVSDVLIVAPSPAFDVGIVITTNDSNINEAVVLQPVAETPKQTGLSSPIYFGYRSPNYRWSNCDLITLRNKPIDWRCQLSRC